MPVKTTVRIIPVTLGKTARCGKAAEVFAEGTALQQFSHIIKPGLGFILYMRAQIQPIIIMEGILLTQRQHFHIAVRVPRLEEVLVSDRDEGIDVVKAVGDDLVEGLDREGAAVDVVG